MNWQRLSGGVLICLGLFLLFLAFKWGVRSTYLGWMSLVAGGAVIRSAPARRKRRGDESLSIAIIEKGAQRLTQATIAQLLSQEFGIAINNDPSAKDFVSGGDGTYVGQIDGRTYSIIRTQGRILPTLTESVPADDIRMRRIVEEHDACTAITQQCGKEDEPLEDRMKAISRFTAALLDEHSMGLTWNTHRELRPVSPEIVELLRTDAVRLFRANAGTEPVSLLPTAETDPRMYSAVAEARRRFPEFVEGWKNRSTGEFFSVSAPLTRAGNTETLWIDVTVIRDTEVEGELGSAPTNLPGLRKGDRVIVPIAELCDWVWVVPGERNLRGSFGLKVLLGN